MSKRAEERALEIYPPLLANCIAFPDSECVDFNLAKRQACQEGYEQAEKDMKWEIDHREEAYMNGFEDGINSAETLTWQGIKRIVKIADDLIPCTPFVSVSEQIFADEFQTEEAYYKEILRKFKLKD